MNDKFFYELIYSFPQLFPDGEESQILVPEGWIPLVRDLCKNIADYIETQSNMEVRVLQIKEKFGILKYCVYGEDDAIQTMIIESEEWSGTMCEVTGAKGFLCEKNGWLKTLSNKEAERLGYKKVNVYK